jgi:hypothetical protein
MGRCRHHEVTCAHGTRSFDRYRMMADWDTWGDTRPLLIGGTDSQWFFRVSPLEEDGRMEVHPPMAAGSRAADQLPSDA